MGRDTRKNSGKATANFVTTNDRTNLALTSLIHNHLFPQPHISINLDSLPPSFPLISLPLAHTVGKALPHGPNRVLGAVRLAALAASVSHALARAPLGAPHAARLAARETGYGGWRKEGRKEDSEEKGKVRKE